MPAWRDEDGVVKSSGPNVSSKTVKLFLLCHLVLAPVPQDACRQVVYGQSPFKVRHSYERQTGKDKRMCLRNQDCCWIHKKTTYLWAPEVTGTMQDIHAKKLRIVFVPPHSRFTESHRFDRVRFFFVFVSVDRKGSDHLYEHKRKQAAEV